MTVALLVTSMTLAGCSSGSLFRSGGGDEGSGGGTSNDPRVSIRELAEIDSEGLAGYLAILQQLISADSLTQAGTFNELRDSAEFAPTTTNRLLYALALSIPGHNGSDPEAAAERLRDLIAAGDTLLLGERMLAQVLLQSADELAILRSANMTSAEQLTSALAERDAEHAERLQLAETEIQRLEAQLEDATAMLDAITNIERSLSEREDNE